jgi:uncharacterized membrane protein
MIPPRMLAALFAVYAGVAVVLLAYRMPPFMNPDEGAHAVRADQISHFGLIAHGGAHGSPALIDTGIDTAYARFAVLVTHPEAGVAPTMYAPIGWGGRKQRGAPNTAIYPPLFYLPAAVALWVGRHTGWSVLPSIILARLATGFAAITLGTCAIALAGAGAVWLFALLLLPMCLAQMAAVSQDGPMLATAALATALWLRLQDGSRPAWHGDLAFLCVSLAAIGMARPPFAAFAILPLAASRPPRPARICAVVFILVCAALWWWVAATDSGVDINHFHANDSGAQMRALLFHPWRIVTVPWVTLAENGKIYAVQFIGWLGWMDVALPTAYVKAAYVSLTLAAASAWLGGTGKPSHARLLLLSIAAGIAGVFFIQYLTWTAVGADAVDGVQGRYFLVPALVAGGLLARPSVSTSRLAAWLALPVMAFPIISIAITLHRITLRYYF